MEDYLSLTDLFLVGLVLDLLGAILFAKGLLISPARINELTTTLFAGGMPGAEEAHFRNRIDAEFGVFYLGFGFLLQVIGYLLEIAGVHNATGGRRLVVAIALALGTALLAWLVWKRFHPIRLERLQERAIEDFEAK